MEVGAPAHEAVPIWLAPELADESAQQEMLSEDSCAHGRHLEGAHLDEPKAAIGCSQARTAYHAELGAMRVAAGVNQQMAEETTPPAREGRSRRGKEAN